MKTHLSRVAVMSAAIAGVLATIVALIMLAMRVVDITSLPPD